MEGLTRLVVESMARYGFEAQSEQQPLQWSQWFRCQDSFSAVLVPGKPGIFTLAEEVIAPGELSATGGKRMLAVFQVSEAQDLGLSLLRLFAPGNPVRSHLATGRCFARYATIEDSAQRRSAREAFEKWIATSAGAASGIVANLGLQSPNFSGGVSHSVDSEEAEDHAGITAPAPLPLGF